MTEENITAESLCQGPSKCGWVESERLLSKTFDQWRAEFRTILEDHRRDIQSRLEAIERKMDQKTDKEFVDVVVRGINAELESHAAEIKSLRAELTGKAGVESLWKVIGLALTAAGLFSGIIVAVIEYFKR